MSVVTTELSGGLQALINDVTPAQDYAEGLFMEQKDVKTLVQLLRIFCEMATNLEIEVRCLRDMEADGKVAEALEEEATGLLSNLLPEADGNVVRPNFGRKS